MSVERYIQDVEKSLINDHGFRPMTAEAAVEKFCVKEIIERDVSMLQIPPEEVASAIGGLLKDLRQKILSGN